MKNGLRALALLIATTICASAEVLYVDANSHTPTAPYSTWDTAASTIQEAIDASKNGDLVLVTNGVYSRGGRVLYGSLTNRVIINKEVTVQSVNGPSVTSIEGNPELGSNAVRCVLMGSNSVLKGFTVKKGATFKTATYQDGAGGGIFATNDSALIMNCVIMQNSAYYAGGGASSGTYETCLIVSNSCSWGGGIYEADSINNCTVVLNNGGGVYGPLTLIYCSILYSNTGLCRVMYLMDCCATTRNDQYYCVTNDPGFVDFEGGNYRLRPDSPCINGGEQIPLATTDLDGLPRPSDKLPDMGAFECQVVQNRMPFYWASLYKIPLDWTVDSDSDGMNNLQEIIAGTNPTNSDSRLIISSVSKSTTGTVINWKAASGKTYSIFRSTNLTEASSFRLLRSNMFAPFALTLSHTDTTATNGGPYFYRVGVK